MLRALRSTSPGPGEQRAAAADRRARAPRDESVTGERRGIRSVARPRLVVARLVLALVPLAIGLALASGPLAGSASAAAIVPSDQGSEVVRTEPPAPGATLTVDGDVARLVVAPGHSATVLGYQGEPFLRVAVDGTVERNERSSVVLADPNSPVTTVASPPSGAGTEVQWVVVGGDGTARWHDHRVHWMAGSPPPSSDGLVMAWRVPMVVDGTTVAIDGEVRRRSVVDPLPWLAVVVITTAIAVVATRRRPLVGVAALAAVGGAVATAVELTPALTARPGGVDLLRLGAAGSALVLGLAGLVSARRRGLLGALGVAALAGWVVPAVPALYQPVVSGPLPVALARVVVAVEVGLVLAGLVAAVAVAGAGQLVDAAGPSSRPSRRRSSLARPDPSSHGAVRQRPSAPGPSSLGPSSPGRPSPSSGDASPAEGPAPGALDAPAPAGDGRPPRV
ncbi:MAG: hypothetical protein U0Q07_05900 [Acidimicrobiales bacterium]